MNGSTKWGVRRSVTAPLRGQILALDRAPDEVFSETVPGGGLAILYEKGKRCGPVNGGVSSVAETLHASLDTGRRRNVSLDFLQKLGKVLLRGRNSRADQGDAGKARAGRVIALLGGRENITLVDACMTRLHVTVRDPALVADLAAWKAEGALGLVKKDNGIQAVYGPEADVLKSDINDIL